MVLVAHKYADLAGARISRFIKEQDATKSRQHTHFVQSQGAALRGGDRTKSLAIKSAVPRFAPAF